FVESVDSDEDKGGGDTDGKRHAAWRQRTPTDIAAAVTPGNPGRAPFEAGNPDPPMRRMMMPIAIMITGPCPRLLAHPVPSEIGPDPITITIRPPLHSHASGTPAMPEGIHFD